MLPNFLRATLCVLFLFCLGLTSAEAEPRKWWTGGMLGGAAEAAEADTTEAQAAAPLDYAEWGRVAESIETQLSDLTTPADQLEAARTTLSEWRERFSRAQAQASNDPRIGTLREQLTALGTPPADGSAEPEDLAKRRSELNEQIANAQAPGLAAEEAYRRADGLVREVDTTLRARSTHELLHRDPAPINPANWPAAVSALKTFGTDLWEEFDQSWSNERRRNAMMQALPMLGLMLALVVVLLWQGRNWIERLIARLRSRLPEAWWGIVELILSLSQIILPIIALAALTNALNQTRFFGPLWTAILTDGVMVAGVVASFALWTGWRLFPTGDQDNHVIDLPPERRAEGRFHVALFALVAAVEALFTSAFATEHYGPSINVVIFPLTAATGLLLFRLGQLLDTGATTEAANSDTGGLRAKVLSTVSKAAMALGVAGPVVGLIGYVSLAEALVRPGMETLGLLSLIAMLQRLTYDIYALVARVDRNRAMDALVPVLISFMLVLAALPILGLIWGMRSTELGEFWIKAREGFRIGETQISPTDFLVFAIIFTVGYGLTKLVQGTLRSAILPKTRLDTGGRNAIVAGTGYLGIVLAALAAISAAGLNLSSLAFVAGALSVGIGFGLQNIVQNFVSGIILLIERPVAEGDWVEVGGVQGIVRGISIRSTRVETFDRTSVIVPNASLISGQVTNYTAFNLSGRVIAAVSVAYESDTRRVEEILREIAEAQPMVVLNPPPAVPLVGLSLTGIQFEIRAILRDVNFGTSVRSDMYHMIVKRFNEEGIAFHFSAREHYDIPGHPPAAKGDDTLGGLLLPSGAAVGQSRA